MKDGAAGEEMRRSQEKRSNMTAKGGNKGNECKKING